MRSLSLLLPRVLLLAGLASSVPLRAAAAEPSSDALPQRIYVWQRAWTPAFVAGVPEVAPRFAAIDVLAAEIAWQDNRAATTSPAIDWKLLHTTGRPIVLVVRIAPSRSTWQPDLPETAAVVAACRQALARARANAVEPVELQLDFDAATARLAAYRALVATIRREVRPPRLTITTLPDWQHSAELPALLAAVDAYVLQVHSLEKPTRRDDPFTLCDPQRAEGWIQRASAGNVPFRIALPSYGYRLVFDADGRFTALEAEGPSRTWPAGYTRREVTADPATLATFVARLLAKPPANCEGIVWFRFPNADDALAWSWPTLRAVSDGRVPQGRLVLADELSASGARDLVLVNTGEADVAPANVRVAWTDARLLAADGLGGWRLTRDGGSAVRLTPPGFGSNGVLRPGERRRVGWVRLDRAAAITPTFLP